MNVQSQGGELDTADNEAVRSALNHLILTRFNLPSGGVEARVRAQEGWLRHRVDLFERYCWPSVTGQTHQHFGWLVYFAIDSPDWLLHKIEAWREFPAFHPVFRDFVPRAQLADDIAKLLPSQRAWLLTTNLDNDDGLAQDFVARLQAVRPKHDRQAVYLTNGLIRTGSDLYARKDRHNAFCSVLERRDSPWTCWADWHNLLGRSMPVELVGGPPAWLQVVHHANVSNRVRGRLTNPLLHRQRFPGALLEGLAEPSRQKLRQDRYVSAPARDASEILRAAAKRALMSTVGKSGVDRVKVVLGGVTSRS